MANTCRGAGTGEPSRVSSRGSADRDVGPVGEGAELGPVVVERLHVGAEAAARGGLDVDPAGGPAGRDGDRRPAVEVGQLHRVLLLAARIRRRRRGWRRGRRRGRRTGRGMGRGVGRAERAQRRVELGHLTRQAERGELGPGPLEQRSGRCLVAAPDSEQRLLALGHGRRWRAAQLEEQAPGVGDRGLGLVEVAGDPPHGAPRERHLREVERATRARGDRADRQRAGAQRWGCRPRPRCGGPRWWRR